MRLNGMYENKPGSENAQNTLKKCSEDEYCLIIEDNTVYEIDKSCASRKWGRDSERRGNQPPVR